MECQLAASNEQGQHLLGSLLEKNIQDDIAQNALEVEAIEKEVLMQAQQAKKEAEEREKQRKRENAVISYTDEDYEVLLRIVQAEAGICDDSCSQCNYQPGEEQPVPGKRQGCGLSEIPVFAGVQRHDQYLPGNAADERLRGSGSGRRGLLRRSAVFYEQKPFRIVERKLVRRPSDLHYTARRPRVLQIKILRT